MWILGRTSEALQSVADLNDAVRDPDSAEDQQPGYARNQYRSRRPEILVLVGLCTHLGCSPKHVRVEQASYFGIADWRGRLLLSMPRVDVRLRRRVFKGVPAPTNPVVPPYQFLSDTVLLIGDDGQETA